MSQQLKVKVKSFPEAQKFKKNTFCVIVSSTVHIRDRCLFVCFYQDNFSFALGIGRLRTGEKLINFWKVGVEVIGSVHLLIDVTTCGVMEVYSLPSALRDQGYGPASVSYVVPVYLSVSTGRSTRCTNHTISLADGPVELNRLTSLLGFCVTVILSV